MIETQEAAETEQRDERDCKCGWKTETQGERKKKCRYVSENYRGRTSQLPNFNLQMSFSA